MNKCIRPQNMKQCLSFKPGSTISHAQVHNQSCTGAHTHTHTHTVTNYTSTPPGLCCCCGRLQVSSSSSRGLEGCLRGSGRWRSGLGWTPSSSESPAPALLTRGQTLVSGAEGTPGNHTYNTESSSL